MGEELYWTTKKGQTLLISEMTTEHIRNCINLIDRTPVSFLDFCVYDSKFDVWKPFAPSEGSEVYRGLEKELSLRELKLVQFDLEKRIDQLDKKGLPHPNDLVMVNVWLDDLIDNIYEIICTNIEQPAGYGCGYGITENGHKELEEYLKTFLLTRLKN